MNTEFWVVAVLVVLSVGGIFWPKLTGLLRFAKGTSRHNPDAFQRRMDLVNELIEECDGCDAETAAVIAAGDVIAKHWREIADESNKER